jgi:hypothetical protein
MTQNDHAGLEQPSHRDNMEVSSQNADKSALDTNQQATSSKPDTAHVPTSVNCAGGGARDPGDAQGTDMDDGSRTAKNNVDDSSASGLVSTVENLRIEDTTVSSIKDSEVMSPGDDQEQVKTSQGGNANTVIVADIDLNSGGVYDEVEIEDLDFVEEDSTFYYPCPCGDKFQITLVSISIALIGAHFFKWNADTIRKCDRWYRHFWLDSTCNFACRMNFLMGRILHGVPAVHCYCALCMMRRH